MICGDGSRVRFECFSHSSTPRDDSGKNYKAVLKLVDNYAPKAGFSEEFIMKDATLRARST
jgi:hypothetical protein